MTETATEENEVGPEPPHAVMALPFTGAVLLMKGSEGTEVWVNESRTAAHILYSDGLKTFGLMTTQDDKKNG